MATESGESFRQEFYRAREDGAHVFMDDTIKIADERSQDPQRQKLRVDTRMRIAGFLNRKQYGTRPEDAALNGRLTLGELVEAAVRHGAQLAANGAPAMLDVTPQRDAPHTEQPLPSANALAALAPLAHAVMTPPASKRRRAAE